MCQLMANVAEGDCEGCAEAPGEQTKTNRSHSWSRPVSVTARNILLMSRCPDVVKHTRPGLTAIDAASDPRRARPWPPRSCIAGRGRRPDNNTVVGNPVQAEVLSGGWGGAPSSGGKWQERFADRKGVHPGSFSVTTRLLDKEGSHQVRKEGGGISLGDAHGWPLC